MASKKRTKLSEEVFETTLGELLEDIGIQLDSVAFTGGNVLVYKSTRKGRYIIIFDQTKRIMLAEEDA